MAPKPAVTAEVAAASRKDVIGNANIDAVRKDSSKSTHVSADRTTRKAVEGDPQPVLKIPSTLDTVPDQQVPTGN